MSSMALRDEQDISRSPEEILRAMNEVVQVCLFCKTFRAPLSLPTFTRTDLEFALIHSIDEYGQAHSLLAEVHYKLCTNYGGHKTPKIVEEWEKKLRSRVREKWKRSFHSNPFKDRAYAELTIRERVVLLNALCDWRLEDSEEIQQIFQDDPDYMRQDPIGKDDEGWTYWYFDDECWVYREGSPQPLLPLQKPRYHVQFSNRVFIRLGVEYVEATKEDFVIEKDRDVKFIVSRVCEDLVDDVERSVDGEVDGEGESTGSGDIMEDISSDLQVNSKEPKVEVEEVESEDLVQNGRRRSSRSRKSVEHYTDTPSQVSEENAVKKEKKIDIEDSSDGESSMEDEEDDNREERDEEDEEFAQDNEKTHEEKNTRRSTRSRRVSKLELTCDKCERVVDGSTLDPPLTTVPDDGWTCMECLVNSARGWPRRSSRASKMSVKEKRHMNVKTSSRSKRQRSETTKKHKSKDKKRDKKKRRSKSSRDYRHDEQMLNTYLDSRRRIEEQQLERRNYFPENPPPPEWEIVSKNVEELDLLVQSLAGGSQEQRSLRSYLQNVLVHMQKVVHLQEKKRKQTFLLQVLPRRKSSRVARSSIRQLADDEDAYMDEGFSRSSRSQSRALARDEGGGEMPTQSPRLELGDWIVWDRIDDDPNPLKYLCSMAINRLLREEIASLFSRPVDAKLDGCVDYFKVVRNPMDLGTIRNRVNAGYYQIWDIFKRDVELVWSNCRLYNPRLSIVTQYATQLEKLFHQMAIQSENAGAANLRDGESDDEMHSETLSHPSDAEEYPPPPEERSRSSCEDRGTDSGSSSFEESSKASHSSESDEEEEFE